MSEVAFNLEELGALFPKVAKALEHMSNDNDMELKEVFRIDSGDHVNMLRGVEDSANLLSDPELIWLATYGEADEHQRILKKIKSAKLFYDFLCECYEGKYRNLFFVKSALDRYYPREVILNKVDKALRWLKESGVKHPKAVKAINVLETIK